MASAKDWESRKVSYIDPKTGETRTRYRWHRTKEIAYPVPAFVVGSRKYTNLVTASKNLAKHMASRILNTLMWSGSPKWMDLGWSDRKKIESRLAKKLYPKCKAHVSRYIR